MAKKAKRVSLKSSRKFSKKAHSKPKVKISYGSIVPNRSGRLSQAEIKVARGFNKRRNNAVSFSKKRNTYSAAEKKSWLAGFFTGLNKRK